MLDSDKCLTGKQEQDGGRVRKAPFTFLILYLILLYISFLRQESSLNTSGLHLTLQIKLNDAVVAREGSSRLNRPLVKFVKHGGLCLAISLNRLILLRCGDVY